MASIEERVDNLETLLRAIVTSINETKNSISKGFNKIEDNFSQIENNFQRVDAELAGLHNKLDQFSGSTDAHIDEVKMTLVSIKEEIVKINTVTNYDEIVTNLKLVSGGKE